MAEKDARELILEAALAEFMDKGMKFTMDDIAKRLSMSKKTIYAMFRGKGELLSEMVDYSFDRIKDSKQKVIEDVSLDTVGKLRKSLGMMPENYRNINFEQLYILRDKYPKLYRQVEERLESGWETTIALLEQGMAEGVIRKIHIPLFQTMFEATLEQFFQRDILVRHKLGYQTALDEVVNILVDGVIVHGEREDS